MFTKMMATLKAKLDNGNGGYAWNSDSETFYNAMYEMAVEGIITENQWKKVCTLVESVDVK